MNTYIYPYRAGSRSVNALAEEIGAKKIKIENSKYQHGEGNLVINWGSTRCPYPCLNPPGRLKVAGNKLSTFKVLDGVVSIPKYTVDRGEALSWIEQGKLVMARTLLNGSGGKGITVVRNTDEMVDAPLYVQYIPKNEEYRVHIMNGEVIDFQRKMRKNGVPDDEVDWKIRNLKGGFIFGRKDVALPDRAFEMCMTTVKELGLDFGAVDLIYNRVHDEYYVLEVNTAPGLEGTTLARYSDGFKRNYCK